MKTNRSKLKSVLRSVLGLILVGITIFGAYSIIRDYQLAKNSEHWPTTIGKVLYHRINTSSSRYSTYYSPIIKYSYSVEDKDYTSETIRYPGVNFKKYSQAADFVSQYPIGSQIEIYYDPTNPSLSCLEMSYLNDPGQERTYILSYGALILLLFGISLACIFRLGMKS
jgi:hypothetical protein